MRLEWILLLLRHRHRHCHRPHHRLLILPPTHLRRQFRPRRLLLTHLPILLPLAYPHPLVRAYFLEEMSK